MERSQGGERSRGEGGGTQDHGEREIKAWRERGRGGRREGSLRCVVAGHKFKSGQFPITVSAGGYGYVKLTLVDVTR